EPGSRHLHRRSRRCLRTAALSPRRQIDLVLARHAPRPLEVDRQLARHPERSVRRMSEQDISAQEAMARGTRLAGREVLAAHPARPGGNNRVFRLDMAGGTPLALKCYPPRSIDGRDRLGQEYAALSFLAGNGIRSTPQPVARDDEANCALYEWFDG